MTEEDRKKVFWYLKRKTSYTAWKRESDAFDRFADIFEKQVREEPIATAGELSMWDTNWETSYPEILKCQVLYEKALAQLKQGDRSVWLYNERGLFHEAWGGHSWHEKLIYRVWTGDYKFDGKYVSELTEAIERFFTVHQDVGYLQPTIEDVGMPDTFYKEKFEANSDLSREAVIFPAQLPDVPVPEEEILVRTGEEVPVFGIYEPQIKDGCMNYLHGGTTARPYDMSEKRPVTWRLIWEDTRYLDGHVSNEEDQYFPHQAMPPKVTPAFVGGDLISALSGQTCPKTGNWAVMNDLQGKAKLNKGDKMPQYLGRDVTWVWSD